MGEKEFVKLCRKCVADYYCWKKYTADGIYIVWLNKTIQNNKAMLSTTKPDGMYFEITYNGDKQELYFDAYKQIDHTEKKVQDDYSSTLSKLLAKISQKYPNITLFYNNGEDKKAELLVIRDQVSDKDYDLYDFKKQEYCIRGLTEFLNIYGGKAYDDINESIEELRWHLINE